MQESIDPARADRGMKYAHWFSLVAEVILGCTIFWALFTAPLAPSIKVLIGAAVLMFAVTSDALSSENDHQATVMLKLVSATPMLIEAKWNDPSFDMLKGLARIQDGVYAGIDDGIDRIVFRVGKYAFWVGAGWAVSKYLL